MSKMLMQKGRVDVEAGYQVVDRIKNMPEKTKRQGVFLVDLEGLGQP